MSSTLGFFGDQVVRLTRELEEVKKQRDKAVTQLEKIQNELDEIKKER